ncbi:MAG: DUF3021 domain-containing protein [Ruminococcaceae bacterium]|nr:DUF3021 domain-containing protein [Oscillospiraceae bacterium]
MKSFALELLKRGAVGCGFGPIVLAIVYWVLQETAGVLTLTVNEVCIGIVSLTALAFIAGGMNAVYKIERLPLVWAILIHGCVLYLSYLATYLVNGWLELGTAPILIFSAIFVVGFFAIWAVIYFVTRKKTAELNDFLKKKQLNYPFDK